MRANLLPERPSYKSSGGVNWLRFVPWLLLALVGSAVLAGLMFLLFKAGHYYIIFVPLVAAVGVAGLMNLVVAKGHCRNRLVAALCGLLAGCVLYFGYYYIGMVYALGTEMAAHPRVLPAYIRFRMATDVLRDTHDYHKHDDEEPSRARGGSSFSNWMFFWIETVLVLGLSAGGALVRARKTYCEKCGRWMLREVTQFEPQKSDQLVQAFQVGSARQLAELCVTPVYSTLPNTSLALEYCPSMKDGRAISR